MVNAVIKWCLENVFLMGIALVAMVASGFYALQQSRVDAIPDIGEKQVIVFADWPGRSPQDVDDQVTYPLTISLTGTPGVKTIRSMSGFGFAMVFVIFQDNVDYYWARSRVLERTNIAQQRLPANVVPVLGPDATALGQIYWYTVEGEGFDLAELRSIQDWYIRYQLNAVEGVSEVASIGGYVKQYQIDMHPDKLHAHRVSLMDMVNAVMKSNIDVGAKVLEKNGIEFFIRGVGFVKSLADIENIVIRQEQGTPIYIKNVARVSLGPEFRRGALDKAGVEVVGGVITMRYGENPLQVMQRVQAKLVEIAPGLARKTLPDGRVSQVQIVPFYDRTDIIHETIDTLKEALTEEALVASLIIVLFLLHLRSTVCVLVTFPLSMLLCFTLMYLVGVDSNIMSLAGLAIAIGDVADMGIIMTENIYRRIATAAPGTGKNHFQTVYEGAAEVGGAILIAVSNTIVSFIPVFFLTDQEGKLFRPLAFTKTFAIGASVVLAITVVPLVCFLLLRPITASRRLVHGVAAGLGVLATLVTHTIVLWGYAQSTHASGWPTAIAVGVIVYLAVVRMSRERFLPLEDNAVSRLITRLYQPSLRWILYHKRVFMVAPCLIVFLGLTVWLGIGFTLYPVEWLLNRFAYEPLSPELRTTMYLKSDGARQRPLLELAELRWQRLQQGNVQWTRLLWRRQDPQTAAAERTAGLEVLQESRIFPGLGREFMPPLDEGSLLYMPSLLPHAALSQAVAINSKQDLAIATVPEVASVVGKLGRAETALDPAPIGMFETIIILKPVAEWRMVPVRRWFSAWPAWLKTPLAWFWPEMRRITKSEILYEMQEKTAIPGVLPTWLQPIQTRLVMLQTGFRAMMGVKIYGAQLQEIERLGLQMEAILKTVPGATDVVADRIVGKPYIELKIVRERIARYGVNIRDVQDVIEIALGGMNLLESVEGRERYPIRLRYVRDLRDDLPDLHRLLVPIASGGHVPLAQVVDISTVVGPQEIKGEQGLLVGYVTMNTRDRDEVSVVEDAEAALQAARRDGRLYLPPGYYWRWGGQFQNQQRAMQTMQIVVPATLLIMFVMLYMGFSRWWVACIIYVGMLVSASGGFMMLWWWGANLSVAVWVGFLVLFGVVDDDGVVMSTYLEDVFASRTFASVHEIRAAVVEAGLRRIRPCLMTTMTTIIGLMPVLLTEGRGADVMQPMAIPSVGGMIVQLLTLFIVPCLFCAIEEWKFKRMQRRTARVTA